MIKINKVFPDLDLFEFIRLNGYSVSSNQYSINVLERHKFGNHRKQYLDVSCIKSLYTLIKLQEKWFIEFIQSKHNGCNSVSSMQTASISIDCYHFDIVKNTKTGTYTCDTVGTDKNFRLFMEYLFEKFKSRYMAEILSTARNGKCSYCQISRANSLDHFLPKSEYPLLAISPWNLVPCCSECNSDISNKNKDIKKLVLLHPFFLDKDLTNSLYFKRDNNSNFFSLKGVNSDAKIKNHIETAKISQKWNSFSLSEISDLKEIYKSFQASGHEVSALTQLLSHIDNQEKSNKVVESILYKSFHKDFHDVYSIITNGNWVTQKNSLPIQNFEDELSRMANVINQIDLSLHQYLQ